MPWQTDRLLRLNPGRCFQFRTNSTRRRFKADIFRGIRRSRWQRVVCFLAGFGASAARAAPGDSRCAAGHAADLVDGVDREARNPIVLSPGTRSVEFDYAPVLLSAQDDLQLRQRLDGFDDWHTAPGSHSAVYTNLPPGKYVFRVKSVNTGNDAERHELTVTLIQKARFYWQPWFWCLCAALLILGAGPFIKFVCREYASVFRPSPRTYPIAREMHDTLLQECIGISSLLEAHAINSPSAGHDTFID